MKQFKLALIALILTSILFVFAKNTYAIVGAPQFKINLEQKEYQSETEITVPINIISSDSFNAYTVNIEYENLEYISTEPTEGWTAINGPSQTDNKVTFTAAMLGKDKFSLGDNTVMNIKFKVPKTTESFKLRGNGQIALTDAKATKISGNFSEVAGNINPGIVETVKTDIKDQNSTISIALRIAAAILIIIVIAFIFKVRKRS